MVGKIEAPQDFYESGVRWTNKRSWIPGWIRDSRFDAMSVVRSEIVRKSRYFEANNAILNRLCDLFEQYTVGANGLEFIPSSSDEEWNVKAKDFWDQWCTMCDVSSRRTFGENQSLVARSWFVDGEAFILKTSGRVRADGNSFPRIQIIETHRVSSPQDAGFDNIVDGVGVDKRGRPIIYYVRQGYEPEAQHDPIDAKDIVHVVEPPRPGMVRGLPFAYPVMNDLHDLDDLQILEMDAAKDAAKTTNVIKTKTGEVSYDDFRRQRFGITGTQGTSGGSEQTRSKYYDEVFGADAKVLKHGDEFEQFVSDRPSVASREYWDYITSKVCAGVGISKLLVFPYSMQGTVVRADLDVSAQFFRARSSVLAARFTEVYLYVMEWATMNNRDLSDPPIDWRNVTVRPPRSVTVDIGRNSSALIAEYEAGWRTLEDICAELGMDYRRVLLQRAKERKLAKQLEVQFQLEPGSLIGAQLEAIKQSQPKQLQEVP